MTTTLRRRIEAVRSELREIARGRVLARHPGFSLAVVLSLGVGISAAAGVFAVVDSARDGQLPYRNAERLEHLYTEPRSSPGIRMMDVPTAAYVALASPDSPAEAVAAYSPMNTQLRDREHTAIAFMFQVTDNFASVIGQRAVVGRWFTASDRESPCLVLAYDFWQTEFGGDSSIVGRAVDIAGVMHTVVGIAERTAYPEFAQGWTSGLRPETMTRRRNASVALIALRRSNEPPEVARQRLVRVGSAAIEQSGRANDRFRSTSFRDFLVRTRIQGAVFILSIIAAFVALLTAVNFAALMLARGIRRRGELGVRAALGAPVARLVTHIVGESLVLCLLGGVLAAILSPIVLTLVRERLGNAVPIWLNLSIGWRTFAGGAGVAAGIGIIFGIGPALDLARPALGAFLRGAGGTVSDGANLARTRSRLVAIQVALATAILVGLGAAFGRVLLISRPDPGFDPTQTIRAALRDGGSRASVNERVSRLVNDARSIPGVAQAAVTETRYFTLADVSGMGERVVTAEDADLAFLMYQRVTDNFFDIMRPSLVGGRLPTADEMRSGMPVVMVSAAVAEQLFGGDAVGRTVAVARGGRATVVGVVADVREHAWETTAFPMIYSPWASSFGPTNGGSVRRLWIRSFAPVPETMRTLGQRNAMGSIDDGRLFAIESLSARLSRELAEARDSVLLVWGIFGVALGLAALGIYGLVAYTAEMKSRELAIREALGASRAHVAARVLSVAVLQAVVGVVAGGLLGFLVIDYLNGFHLKLTMAVGASALSFVLVGATVLVAAAAPLVRIWRRDLSLTLRAGD